MDGNPSQRPLDEDNRDTAHSGISLNSWVGSATLVNLFISTTTSMAVESSWLVKFSFDCHDKQKHTNFFVICVKKKRHRKHKGVSSVASKKKKRQKLEAIEIPTSLEMLLPHTTHIQFGYISDNSTVKKFVRLIFPKPFCRA